MKGSQFMDVFKAGNIVIPLYFLRKYKKFNLTMEEFLFLMYLYHLGDKSLFNPNRYSEDLDLDSSKVMEYIGTLTDRKLIQVEVIKNEKDLMEEVVLLDGFYRKLSLFMVEDSNEKSANYQSNIFETIEKEFGRTLSPIEYEIIKAWLDNDMDEALIKEAIKEATFNGVSNLRYIDKILYEWGKLGIKTVKDVENHRRKRAQRREEEADSNVDLDIVDWDWFDDDDE